MDIDVGSAFTFMFDDEKYIGKIGVGGLALLGGIFLFPLFLVNGYMFQTLQRVRNNQKPLLPAWDDFNVLILKGLVVSVIWLMYNIPALLVACSTLGILAAVPTLDLNSEIIPAVNTVSTICWSCLSPLLFFLGNALFPAALIQYAEYDTFISAFRFGEIFSLISNSVGDYIVVVLLGFVAQTIAGIGFIFCGIGLVFSTFWSFLVMANLYGQFARKVQVAT